MRALGLVVVHSWPREISVRSIYCKIFPISGVSHGYRALVLGCHWSLALLLDVHPPPNSLSLETSVCGIIPPLFLNRERWRFTYSFRGSLHVDLQHCGTSSLHQNAGRRRECLYAEYRFESMEKNFLSLIAYLHSFVVIWVEKKKMNDSDQSYWKLWSLVFISSTLPYSYEHQTGDKWQDGGRSRSRWARI